MSAILSNREMQVTELLAWGHSDRDVADELFISYNTARTHHRRIYEKTGCRNLSDITRWYFQQHAKVCFGIPAKLFNLKYLRVRTFRVQNARDRKSGRKQKTYFL